MRYLDLMIEGQKEAMRIGLDKRENWTPLLIHIHATRLIIGLLLGFPWGYASLALLSYCSVSKSLYKGGEMDKRIEEILDAFDFDRVKKIMTTLDWKWGIGKDEHAPSYNELRQTAKMLLEDSYLMGRSATGGLEAESSEGILRLIFIVTQAEIEEE